MIPLLLVLAAAQAGAAPGASMEQGLYRSCTQMVKQDPEKAVAAASEWRTRGGGLFARQCLGQAYVALERWLPAATAFEQAAREAETIRDSRAGDLWSQSGNAWLAANDAAKARAAFDAALSAPGVSPELRGEIFLDRARADVALGEIAVARADLDKGLGLVAADPFAWYLSAALALREKALPRAQTDIAKAVELAPDDADVLLLAGNIAGTAGSVDKARGFYLRAAQAAPDSPAGKSAQAALAANPAEADGPNPVAPTPLPAPTPRNPGSKQ